MSRLKTAHLSGLDIPQLLKCRLPQALRSLCWPTRKPLDPDELHSRRSFVQEVVARNPEAFSSELDVEAMMQYYR